MVVYIEMNLTVTLPCWFSAPVWCRIWLNFKNNIFATTFDMLNSFFTRHKISQRGSVDTKQVYGSRGQGFTSKVRHQVARMKSRKQQTLQSYHLLVFRTLLLDHLDQSKTLFIYSDDSYSNNYQIVIIPLVPSSAPCDDFSLNSTKVACLMKRF